MARAANSAAIHSARFYEVYDVIATGGMATVHLGRVVGDAGFGRVVAIKRLHPQFVGDPEFAAMFVDEARLASRILHANVPPMLDVVAQGRELLLIMEYVHGESLSRLLTESRAAGETVSPAIAVTILADVLHGLHAAHEATSPDGSPLRLVHRDVSPQNVLVGADGIGRIVDFGVAKALGRMQMTRDGAIKGKLAYIAPEQLSGRNVDRRADVYSAGVVLWETLTGTRLFQADSEGELIGKVLEQVVVPPSHVNPKVPTALDDIAMRALERDPARRFAGADEMASALEQAMQPASTSAVGAWVRERASKALRTRADLLARMDSGVAIAGATTAPRPTEEHTTERVRFVLPNATIPDAMEASPAPVPAPPPVAIESSPKRTNRTWIAVAIALVAASLVAIIALRFAAAHVATPAPAASIAPSTSPSIDAPPPSPTIDAVTLTPPMPSADPSSASTSRARTPPRPVSTTEQPKWCKVFDPEKRIFVVKPMTGGRCP